MTAYMADVTSCVCAAAVTHRVRASRRSRRALTGFGRAGGVDDALDDRLETAERRREPVGLVLNLRVGRHADDLVGVDSVRDSNGKHLQVLELHVAHVMGNST